jgi:hypothetical protein
VTTTANDSKTKLDNSVAGRRLEKCFFGLATVEGGCSLVAPHVCVLLAH